MQRILLINFGMIMGTWIGFKTADACFWDNDVKYRVWEETERKFWKEKQKPEFIKPLTEFESFVEPGTMFRSYIGAQTVKTYDEMVEKYKL